MPISTSDWSMTNQILSLVLVPNLKMLILKYSSITKPDDMTSKYLCYQYKH